MKLNAVLFKGFETLDIFGPIEMFGTIDEIEIGFYSMDGGVIDGKNGVRVLTQPLSEIEPEGTIIIPGGAIDGNGHLDDAAFIAEIARLASEAGYVLSVCNGAYLYAKAGVLDGKLATTYKGGGFVDRAEREFPQVKWQRRARWTTDGNVYTSSGVSAGMDMALGFIADVFGRDRAEAAANYAEYAWNDSPENDPFAC